MIDLMKNKMAGLLAYDLKLLLGREKISQMEMTMAHSSEFYSTQMTGEDIIVQIDDMKTHLSAYY